MLYILTEYDYDRIPYKKFIGSNLREMFERAYYIDDYIVEVEDKISKISSDYILIEGDFITIEVINISNFNLTDTKVIDVAKNSIEV